MRRFILLLVLCLGAGVGSADAQEAPVCAEPICWTLVSRFRLFQREEDFAVHERAWRQTSGDHRVLDSERLLNETSARGWAATVVGRLCFDEMKNIVAEGHCLRDGINENYLNPRDFKARLDAPPPDGYANAACFWRIGVGPRDAKPCLGASARLPRTPTEISVVISAAGMPDVERRVMVTPHDLLVAGMGDSFTSGEGNPDVPVRLAATGFQGVCYGRLLAPGSPPIYLPTRDVQFLSRDCGSGTRFDASAWVGERARWMYAPCHRSLYGNQLRAALALALDDPHRTVTYLPLGCTGAEIEGGLFSGQASREKMGRGGVVVAPPEGQIGNATARLRPVRRSLDILFLSIGGNDVGFSGLVANVIVRKNPERGLMRAARLISTLQESRAKLTALAPTFALLGGRLGPLVAGDLSRVVYLPYGNVATAGSAKAICGNSRRGFDGHPAFGVDGSTLAATSRYVENELVPTLERYARRPGCGWPTGTAPLSQSTGSAPRKSRPSIATVSRLATRSRSRMGSKSRSVTAIATRPSGGPTPRADAGCAPPTTATSPR